MRSITPLLLFRLFIFDQILLGAISVVFVVSVRDYPPSGPEPLTEIYPLLTPEIISQDTISWLNQAYHPCCPLEVDKQ